MRIKPLDSPWKAGVSNQKFTPNVSNFRGIPILNHTGLFNMFAPPKNGSCNRFQIFQISPLFLKKWFRPESWMLWAKFRLNPGPANSKNQPWNLKPVIVWSQHFSDSNWRRQDGLRTISGHQEEDHGEGWPGTGTVFSGQKKGPELPEPWPIRVMLREFQKITGFLICENTQRYTLGGSDFLENNSI